jgi:hypothetical protein
MKLIEENSKVLEKIVFTETSNTQAVKEYQTRKLLHRKESDRPTE